MALVWQPGQVTAIHDHVTWCVFGVIQGVEHEELFTLDEERGCLVEAERRRTLFLQIDSSPWVVSAATASSRS